MRLFALPCVCLFVLALLSGCGGGNSSPAQSNGLQFVAYTDKTVYTRGEPITFTLAVTNVSSKPISVEILDQIAFAVPLGGSQQFTFYCRSGELSDSVIYDLSPGETHSFTAVWDQKDSQSPPQLVSSGHYTAQLSLTPHRVNGLTYTFAQAKAQFFANPFDFIIQ